MEYKGIKLHNEQDKGIVSEIKPTYLWMLTSPKEDVIMDIGANIGCFAFLAGEKGYKKIVCYEPEPSNLELLKVNTKELENCEIVDKAILTNPNATIDFFLPKNRRNMGSCSAYVKRGRDKISVKTINFKDEMERIKPNIIKMDVEGAEYDLLKTPLPHYVKKITIELHLNKNQWRYEDAPELIDKFKNWKCIREPIIGEKNWHTIAKYERE